MPRPKGTVGFWRGPYEKTKPSLLPRAAEAPRVEAPRGQGGTTLVASWPREYRDALRRRLVALKQRDSNMTTAALRTAAQEWASAQTHPGPPVPKKIKEKHVLALLTPPRNASATRVRVRNVAPTPAKGKAHTPGNPDSKNARRKRARYGKSPAS